ncbi:cation diffusion facilitator family transporter [Xanthobacter autotrophicus]|uniref:cation diffusion facilitator family transporter n=1 Tax=Xanthobacter autotrophicus TaxID=280 RepID=UPI0024A6CFC9|nr:cation diffusion facilitator family transporter [Xanthobacter autotrophicus]MDI4658442.1 cation diffusion facilitator family transporter [Xanthobacter autotrophicus]
MASPETGTHDHDHENDHDHAGGHAHGDGEHGHPGLAHAGHSHAEHGHSGHGQSGHGHDHAVPDSLRAFAIGAGLNFGFVIVEVIFGLYAGSLALLADAGHNLSDVLGLVLAWGAAWLSRRAPTRLRTYGYGRSSILAALANAMILLLGTGGIILEAISRLSQPEPVQTGIVMVVALVGVAVNMGTALMFMAGRKGDLNVRGAFIHMVADGAISLGVVAAAGVIALTGWLWLDPVVSLVIAVAIIVGTWGLLRDSVNLAMDMVPTGVDPEQVEAFLAARPGVREVHDLHIWGLSTTSVALSAHLVRPEAALDDDFLSETCAELKARFGIAHPVLQIEQGRMACALAPRDVV